jgi:hypothetical protein
MTEIETFLYNASATLKKDDRILALCAGGSWITKEIDEFSDLDLVIITRDAVSDSKSEMEKIAASLGTLAAAFTGEHVGERRLLICLYENPTLHVDLKFVLLEEFDSRVENPVIIWDRDNVTAKAFETTMAKWPSPDFQWIEDRFWVWIHYVAAKLGRGELFEAIDFLAFLRVTVIGSLFHLKYKSLPRAMRKIEFILNDEDLIELKKTIPVYSFDSIKSSIYQTVHLYNELRAHLFDSSIVKRNKAEIVSIHYLDNIVNSKTRL